MHNRCGALRDNRDAIANCAMTQKFSRMSAAGDTYKHVAFFTTRDTKMISDLSRARANWGKQRASYHGITD